MQTGYCLTNDTKIDLTYRQSICSSDASNFTVLPKWACPNELYCIPGTENFPSSFSLIPNKNESWSHLLHDVSISNLLAGSHCKYLIKFPPIGGPNDTIELVVNRLVRAIGYVTIHNTFSSLNETSEIVLTKGTFL
jgi:hypothetical protein